MSTHAPTQAPLTGVSLTPDPNIVQTPGMTPSTMAIPQFEPEKLADIHLPETISYWPVAPGWWLLVALLILTLLIIIFWKKSRGKNRFLSHHKKIKLLKKQAKKELQTILSTFETQKAAHESTRQLSVFLRRYALSVYPREQVASVTDEQWLKLLDKLSDTNLFSNKFAELLTTVPYQPQTTTIDSELLLQLFEASARLLEVSHREADNVQF